MRRHGTLNSIRRTKQLIAVDIWDHSCASQSRPFFHVRSENVKRKNHWHTLKKERFISDSVFLHRRLSTDTIWFIKAVKFYERGLRNDQRTTKNALLLLRFLAVVFLWIVASFFLREMVECLIEFIMAELRVMFDIYFLRKVHTTQFMLPHRYWVQCIQIKSRCLKCYTKQKFII